MNTKNNNVDTGGGKYTGRDNIELHVNYKLDNIIKEDISLSIDKKLLGFDKKISSVFPQGILSPTYDAKTVAFDSSKILKSLGMLGIPIQVSLHVLNELVNELVDDNCIEQLTTNHVRKVISQALYGFPRGEGFTQKETERWGDNYIRHYGDPEKKFEIVHNNGRIEYLSISLLKTDVIPNVCELMSDDIKFTDFNFSNTQKQVMADDIKESLMSLNIYRIHYSSLITIVREMATQPPHPWFINYKEKNYYIEYNYSKLIMHYEILSLAIAENTYIQVKFHVDEVIYHACATILGYLKLHIGCGINAPLTNLQYYLKLLSTKTENNLLEYSSINDIFFHFEVLNIDILDFRKTLDSILNNPIKSNQVASDEFRLRWKNINELLRVIESFQDTNIE